MTWKLLDIGDGTKWADPEDDRAHEVEYVLRHSPDTLTREDQLMAATLIAHYRGLTRQTGADAARIVAAMRRAREAKQ